MSLRVENGVVFTERYPGERPPEWVHRAVAFYTSGDKPTIAETSRHVHKANSSVINWLRRMRVVSAPEYHFDDVLVCGCGRDYLTVALGEPCCNPEYVRRRVG